MNTVVSNESHLINVFKEIQSIVAKGKIVAMAYDPVKTLKTKKQLGFVFGGLITALQKWEYETQGESSSKDGVKSMLYNALLKPDVRTVCGIMTPVYTTLSMMTTKEASQFIEDVIDFADGLPDMILPVDLRYSWLNNITSVEMSIVAVKVPTWKPKQKAYLSHLRGLNCLYCGLLGCQAHHVRQGTPCGMGQKPADYYGIPLCERCHDLVHRVKGEEMIYSGMGNVLHGFSIKQFCELSFDRWYNKQ